MFPTHQTQQYKDKEVYKLENRPKTILRTDRLWSQILNMYR
mgnify:CR=1 FL=1